jgi:hypothetical protein
MYTVIKLGGKRVEADVRREKTMVDGGAERLGLLVGSVYSTEVNHATRTFQLHPCRGKNYFLERVSEACSMLFAWRLQAQTIPAAQIVFQ